jgi:hypothetical protein
MRKLLCMGVLACASLSAADLPASRLWTASAAALAASQAADVWTSVRDNGHGQEKGGIAAGAVGIEYLILRLHPRSARKLSRGFAALNFGIAASTSAVAVHNMGVR